MSAKNKARGQIALVLLATSLLLLLLAWFAGSGWSFFLTLLGEMLFLVSMIMLVSLSVIEGVPLFLGFLSLQAEPVWRGEILYVDGGANKIRYLFDTQRRVFFVADDICLAAGTNPPLKDAKKWGGVPLFTYGEHVFFSEPDVQEFLMPLANKNHDATRLLLLIRNNVLRKLNKQREADRVGSKEVNCN